MKTALIAGSTGLIGKELLSLLLESPRYTEVIALTRRPIDANHSKLRQVITDVTSLKEKIGDTHVDDVYCCLGSTMKKAGSKEKFYEADFTYPHELAKITQTNGANQFLIVTAMGADKDASIFYNRVKGEVEVAISKLPFRTIHIVRPSLLFGSRRESRPGEMAGKILFTIFGPLIPKKYKGIEGKRVAKAMLYFASQNEKGIFIHDSGELQSLNLGK